MGESHCERERERERKRREMEEILKRVNTGNGLNLLKEKHLFMEGKEERVKISSKKRTIYNELF